MTSVHEIPAHERVKYEVLSCTISDESLSTVILDDVEVELPTILVVALSHLQLADYSRIIFNDHLVFQHKSPDEAHQLVEELPRIHQQAEKIIIWAGTDDEDDALSPFIGKGSPQSTTEAFEFAYRLADSPDSAIPNLFNEDAASDRVTKWSRFQQLIYRDFFQGDPILTSNYTASLPHTYIQVSSATIPYPVLQKAGAILLQAHPLPTYLSTLPLHPPPHLLSVPPAEWSSQEDDWWAALAYKAHLQASIRFGLPTQLLMVQIHYLIGKASKELESRLVTHMGFCAEIYDSRGGLDMDIAGQHIARFHHQLQDDEGRVSENALRDPVGKYARTTPAFDGRKGRPMTPVAAHRETFVHALSDQERFVVLLEILPDDDLATPLQCGLREVSVEEECGFAFVANHLFLRPPLYEEEPSHEQKGYPLFMPPLASRESTLILINDRSYPVPRLQEIFLRLHRDKEESRLVYLWNVCRRPQEVGMFDTERMGVYVRNRERVLGREKHEVLVVDMYKVLERAGEERDRGELEKLGLGREGSWDEWLLQLAD